MEKNELNSINAILEMKQEDFEEKLITEAMLLDDLKSNEDKYLDYFKKNRECQFCEKYISPKLKLIQAKYRQYFRII